MAKYEELIVWQKSMDLVDAVYDLIESAAFPKYENNRLVDQLMRAVVSIPSNIAEGAGRAGEKEFRNFLSIARGSCWEVGTQLKIAQRRGYCQVSERLSGLLNEVDKILTTMIFNRA